MAFGENHRRGEQVLLVLQSLPARHEMAFYRELRKRCISHVTLRGTADAERSSAASELLSEVMAKLLAVGSSRGDEERPAENATDGPTSNSAPPDLATDMDAPERDGRVLWLLQVVGGRRALDHRLEDMRRGRFGRSRGEGYRFVQISALGGSDADERDEDILAQREERDLLRDDPEDPHHDTDVKRAWAGVLAAASRRFEPHEDAHKLIDLLARDPDVQEGFGVEWPVRRIAEALTRIDPPPPWTDHRVENAKKRLRTWIGGLERDYGLDPTDLMGLFARYGREAAAGTGSARERAGTPSPAKGPRP